MNEWLLLYALGFFFACGQKFPVLIALRSGVLISHDKSRLIAVCLFDVVFWFITVPLALSSAWQKRSADSIQRTGLLDMPIEPEMPEPKAAPDPECPKCGQQGPTQSILLYECGHAFPSLEELKAERARLLAEWPHEGDGKPPSEKTS